MADRLAARVRGLPLSHLGSGNANDGVPGSIEGWFAAEDLDSDGALFENVSVPLGCLRHYKAQEVGITAAVPKVRTG